MSPEGPVLVVGAGLLGTSIGLALRRAHVDVAFRDLRRKNVQIASGLGAANLDADGLDPALVVVAVPPDHLAEVVAEWLARSSAVVTDVGSVKSAPLRAVRERQPDE